MTKTEHYQLNQWDPEDRVTHTDFNADNAKIDTALLGKADTASLVPLQDALSNLQTSISNLQTTLNQTYSPSNKCFVTGSYTGNGTAARTISIGFTPSAVLLFTSSGYSFSGYAYMGGLAIPGVTLDSGLSITTNGFQVVYSGSKQTNMSGTVYYYLAFR